MNRLKILCTAVAGMLSMVLSTEGRIWAQSDDPLQIGLSVLSTENYCEVTITATNSGDNPLTLKFNTAQHFDFYAKDVAQRIIWQWSNDVVFADVRSAVQLMPGDSITKKVQWKYVRNDGYRVKGGRYWIMGAVTARPQNKYSDPQEIEVPTVFKDNLTRQTGNRRIANHSQALSSSVR